MQTLTTAKTTADNELPVTVQQAKNQLDIVNDDDDLEIRLCLGAAIDYCERVTGRSLRVSHTVVQSYSQWPCAPVCFEWQPAYSITHVKYYDSDDAIQTVSSSLYRLIKGNAASKMEWRRDFARPALSDRSDAVQVTYLAGYADIADVPDAAKKAVLLVLENTWGNVEGVMPGPLERSIGTLLAAVDTGAYR